MAVCKLVIKVHNFRKESLQFAYECCVITNAVAAEQHPKSLEGPCACEDDSPGGLGGIRDIFLLTSRPHSVRLSLPLPPHFYHI